MPRNLCLGTNRAMRTPARELPLCSFQPGSWCRRCSGAEWCGKSSGAIQTDRHAVCSLLPQTQRLQRRGGGAAVRRLGWPGLCWKDLALPQLNTQPLHLFDMRKHTLPSNVCLFIYLCPYVSSLSMKVLSAASPSSLSMRSWNNAVAAHCLMYVLYVYHPLASFTYLS